MISVHLSGFSINLLAFYHKCCSLIGYATHYLSCCRKWVEWEVNSVRMSTKMAAASSRFRSVCEEDLDNFWIIFWTSRRFILKQLVFLSWLLCVIVVFGFALINRNLELIILLLNECTREVWRARGKRRSCSRLSPQLHECFPNFRSASMTRQIHS